MIRTYNELAKLNTFDDRFRYLMLKGVVGEETFGADRFLNQDFYKSREWRNVRNFVITRDLGRDLGVEGREIHGKILIHHMNPILSKDIATSSRFLLNPDFLITTIHTTHNAIHYGDESILAFNQPAVRLPNDTCPWKH